MVGRVAPLFVPTDHVVRFPVKPTYTRQNGSDDITRAWKMREQTGGKVHDFWDAIEERIGEQKVIAFTVKPPADYNGPLPARELEEVLGKRRLPERREAHFTVSGEISEPELSAMLEIGFAYDSASKLLTGVLLTDAICVEFRLLTFNIIWRTVTTPEGLLSREQGPVVREAAISVYLPENDLVQLRPDAWEVLDKELRSYLFYLMHTQNRLQLSRDWLGFGRQLYLSRS